MIKDFKEEKLLNLMKKDKGEGTGRVNPFRALDISSAQNIRYIRMYISPTSKRLGTYVCTYISPY